MLSEADVKALAHELAKHSGLHTINLGSTVVFFDDCGWERG